MASKNNPVQVKQLRDFTGGMVYAPASAFVGGEKQFYTIKNMFYNNVGLLESRGTVKAYSSAENAGTTSTRRVWFWTDNSGTEWGFLVDQANDIYVSSTTTFSATAKDATFTHPYMSYAAMEGKLYVAARNHDTCSWDGTTWTTITDHTLDGSGSEFPRAAILVAAHSRMFAFNVAEGAGPTTYSSRVWFSEAGDAETWLATSWIDIAADDGQQIMAAISFRDEILIFKETSMYLLTGTDPDSFAIYKVSDRHGTTGSSGSSYPSRQVAVGEKRAYWLDTDSHRVMSFDGADVKTLEPPMPATSSPTPDASGVMATHAEKLYYSAGGSFSNTSYVFDIRVNAWTKLDFGVQDWFPHSGRVYVAGPVHTSGSYDGAGTYYFDPFSYGILADGATTYPVQTVTSGWINLLELGTRLRVKYVDVLLASDYEGLNTPITVKLYTNYDLGSPANTKTFTWTQDGAAQRLRLPMPTDSLGTTPPRRVEAIQYSVSTDGTAHCRMALVGVDIGFTVPPVRQRGDRSVTE